MSEKKGLWYNIHKKRERIKRGSGERMRKPGEKGAPTQDALKRSQGEEVSPMIKAPKTKQFADKAAALAHSKSNGGKVYKSTFINPRTGIKDISYVVKEEAVAEAVDKSSGIYKEYLGLKKSSLKELRAMIKLRRKVVDVSGYDKQGAISYLLRSRYGNKDVAAALGLDEMTTTADVGIPQDTKNMGPRLKSTVMHDRRRRKDAIPVLLKRFRKYIEDKNIG